MRDIAIYGAGGFGKTISCLINAINKSKPEWNFIGFFDDACPIGTKVHYAEVLGGMSVLNSYNRDIAIVFAIGNPHVIKKLASKIHNPNVYFPNLIAPNVSILDEDTLKMGKGNLVLFDCLISNHVIIGDFNTLNCGTYLGHDDTIGSFNSMMPSVRISGEVEIGDLNFFGVSSVVLQRKKIGNNTVIAANSVIMRNTKDGYTYIGNPAKKLD